MASVSCSDFASRANIPSWNVTSGSGTLLYGSDDRCDSYSVSMSFPGLPLESPVSFLFHPPDCDGLIELSFPLASDFPAGMACLINNCEGVFASATMILVNSQSNSISHSDRPTINGTASCTPGGEAVMKTFLQGSHQLRNSTAHDLPAHGMNSSSNPQAGNGTAAGTGTGLGLGGPPSNGTNGALNSPQGSIATPTGSGWAPTVSGQGMGNGAPPATPTTTVIATASSPGSDSLAGAAPPSTLLTITTPGSPGESGSQSGPPPGVTPVNTGLVGASQAASTPGSDNPGASVTTPSLASQTAPPGQTVDGQEIPDSGGPMESTPPVAQTTGANGATGGDGPTVTTAGGGTDPGQSAAASTCRCN